MGSLVSLKKHEGKFHSTKEIRSFNETKQYTLMATGVLEFLVTDSDLTASAAKLWEYLYTKAIMNEKLCIKIRYKDLAQKFNRTERTMKRYVENLKDHGYLHVESNYYNYGQKANTYYLKLPHKIIECMQNIKDRKKIDRVDIDTPSDLFHSKDVDIHVDEIASEIKESAERKVEYVELHLGDKSVTPGHDINVTPKNNIKEILNNDVVVISAEMSSTKDKEVLRETNHDLLNIQDQENINKLESEINLLFIKMGQVISTEKVTIFDRIRQLQGKVSSILVGKRRREQAELVICRTGENEKSTNLADNSLDFSTTKGERELSSKEMTKIKKAVEKLTDCQNDTRRICNEIAYAVRFGALRISQSGDALTMPHAVSIAIKLLRDGRWETPSNLKNRDKNFFHYEKKHLQSTLHGQKHIKSVLQSFNVGS